MSGSCLWPLQQGTQGLLAADSTLVALIGGTLGADTHVYDAVTENHSHPYVVHGDAHEERDDTFGHSGKCADFAVEAWSRYAGSKEVKTIADRIAKVLETGSISVSGYVVTSVVHMRTVVTRQPDGVSRWVAVWFRAYLREP